MDNVRTWMDAIEKWLKDTTSQEVSFSSVLSLVAAALQATLPAIHTLRPFVPLAVSSFHRIEANYISMLQAIKATWPGHSQSQVKVNACAILNEFLSLITEEGDNR